MNMFETMVRWRIDDLVGLAGRVRQERDLRAARDLADTAVLAVTAGEAPEAPRPAPTAVVTDPAQSDRPECPSSARAA